MYDPGQDGFSQEASLQFSCNMSVLADQNNCDLLNLKYHYAIQKQV